VRGTQMLHVLDLVFTNKNFVDSIEHLSPRGKSDHCVLSINCKLSISIDANVSRYKYDKGDYDGLCNYFDSKFCLDKLSSINISVGDKWDIFKNTLVTGTSNNFD
jgi:hypothetical protein